MATTSKSGGIEDRPFDAALVDCPNDGPSTLIGKARRQMKGQPDPTQPMPFDFSFSLKKKLEPFARQLTFLTEAQSIETGAGPHRSQEQIEGSRRQLISARFSRLVSTDMKPVEASIHSDAAGKSDFHDQPSWSVQIPRLLIRANQTSLIHWSDTDSAGFASRKHRTVARGILAAK
jgi:hypothetical protein